MIDKSNPFFSKICVRSRLTKEGSSKETYHISLDLTGSNLQFRPGDSIGIFAQNDPLLVSHLLEAMGAKGDESIIDPRSKAPMSIRSFLTHKANLSRLTSPFLKLFYELEEEHDKKNKLHKLLEQDNKPQLSHYLSNHDPLSLFKEYENVKAPLQTLCENFGPLLPRFYSIASSLACYPNQVHLTVAVFTFDRGGERRFGVASHFLCHLATLGDTPIPLYVQTGHAFALPTDSATPIIMIGPGTGVAPYRAFMQERVAQNTQGENWLFFGERNQATDFFYEEEWQKWVEQGKLRLDLAFSRDQVEKLYVQHRLEQRGAEIFSWIKKGAHLYICGDAHQMAKDVEETLCRIVEQHGGKSPVDAKNFLKQMRKERKLLLDVY